MATSREPSAKRELAGNIVLRSMVSDGRDKATATVPSLETGQEENAGPCWFPVASPSLRVGGQVAEVSDGMQLFHRQDSYQTSKISLDNPHGVV